MSNLLFLILSVYRTDVTHILAMLLLQQHGCALPEMMHAWQWLLWLPQCPDIGMGSGIWVGRGNIGAERERIGADRERTGVIGRCVRIWRGQLSVTTVNLHLLQI